MENSPDQRTLARVKRLAQLSKSYYNGVAEVSDEEFDAERDALAALLGESALDKLLSNLGVSVGAPPTGATIVHPVLVGSLSKAKTFEEIKSWARGAKKGDFLVSEKLDGVSVVLRYVDGVFTSAATRGNGKAGTDITTKVKKTIGFVPSLPLKGDVYIRGEILMHLDVFETLDEKMANPRNVVSGLVNSKSNSKSLERCHLYVYSYLQGGGSYDRKNDLNQLSSWGFLTPFWECGSLEIVEILYQNYVKVLRASLLYEIDGLVVEYNNSEDRDTEVLARPNHAVAWKFESQSARAVFDRVTWNKGKSGRVIPTAIFSEVHVAGVNITKASLHSRARFEELVRQGLRQGSVIEVSRRNDVIPHVERVVSENPDGDLLSPPVVCPSCGGDLTPVQAHIECHNPNCRGDLDILHWCKTLEIKGLGKTHVKSTWDSGFIASVKDLYAHTEEEWQGELGAIGVSIFKELQAKRQLSLQDFLVALNIPDCSEGTIGKILKGTKAKSLADVWSLRMVDLAGIGGLGTTKISSFLNAMKSRREMMLDLLREISIVEIKSKQVVPGKTAKLHSVVGKTFCFTGFRSQELEDSIVASGGFISTSVTKATTHLVCKDPTSNSSKIQKARQMGVRVIPASDVMADRV